MLKKEIIKGIQDLVQEIKIENKIINEIIRDDVFSILQACDCTVLYYPLEGEDGQGTDGIDGCHIERMVNDQMEQFVFINTNTTRERQAFSAAHELGHIWKVDERIRKKFPDEEIDTEKVVNRFAAELLMPEKHFCAAMDGYLEKIKYVGPSIEVTEMIRLIAFLMNEFFVPFLSVVKRFTELEKLTDEESKRLEAYKDSNLLKEIIKAEQYTRLGIVNCNKSMDNLQEYLQEIEARGLFNETKIKKIKEDFGIEDVENTTDEVLKF